MVVDSEGINCLLGESHFYLHVHFAMAASTSCACFSFCTVHEATASLARIPTTLYAASPWLKYLRRVYGSSYEMVEGGAIVDELDRLQFIYARGLPIARCGRGQRRTNLATARETRR